MHTTSNSSENTDHGDEPPPLLIQDRASSRDIPIQLEQPQRRRRGRWDDWRWQMSNRIRDVSGLVKFFPEFAKPAATLSAVTGKYPLAITPYYASLIDRLDESDPIFAMSVPQAREMNDPNCLSEDPLEENQDMPVPGLVHRYPDRALLIVTTACSTYCRHCTRKRVAGTREASISQRRLNQIAEYLTVHSEIHDVIVSGGDPFTMPTEALEKVLLTLRTIPSISIIRIGTRTPAVLPQRITAELTDMLRKYHPVWINTHFNHPRELTDQAAEACSALADAGIPLGNQSVLLAGINDNPATFERLCRGLIRMRVRPYYLFQCDLVKGVEHFRTPISRGIEIMEYLRGRLSGLAIPNFVVDAPHGGGKIPILPNYIVSVSPTHTVLRNFEGMLVNYPEPGAGATIGPREDRAEAPGVWDLAIGAASAIVPEGTRRYQRRKDIVRDRHVPAEAVEKF